MATCNHTRHLYTLSDPRQELLQGKPVLAFATRKQAQHLRISEDGRLSLFLTTPKNSGHRDRSNVFRGANEKQQFQTLDCARPIALATARSAAASCHSCRNTAPLKTTGTNPRPMPDRCDVERRVVSVPVPPAWPHGQLPELHWTRFLSDSFSSHPLRTGTGPPLPPNCAA